MGTGSGGVSSGFGYIGLGFSTGMNSDVSFGIGSGVDSGVVPFVGSSLRVEDTVYLFNGTSLGAVNDEALLVGELLRATDVAGGTEGTLNDGFSILSGAA